MPFDINSLENHWMPFSGNRDFKTNPRLVVKSEGMYCWIMVQAVDGSSGLFCTPAGHGRREIADAVYKQMVDNGYIRISSWVIRSFELASRVARIFPDPLNHVFS